MKRALVFLLLSCSKEAPKPTVDASASVTLPKTTCEQAPWDEAARAKHRTTAAKLGNDTAPLIINVLATKPVHAVTSEIFFRLQDKVAERGTGALSPSERTIYFTEQLRTEVANGGLHQFFFNSAGNCSLQTSVALKDLGHMGLSNLFAQALERFPSTGPVEDRYARQKQIDALPTNAWDETTRAMNRLNDLDEHIAKYVKTHSALLELPPRKY